VGILAMCMGLAGCSVVKDVAELVRELTNTEERNYVRDPSLKALPDLSEFDVYEDGKPVLTTEEMGEGFSFNEPYSSHFGEGYLGIEYDFSGRELSTKRGIHIGSTMEEVVEAYPDIAFKLFPEKAGGQSTFDISAAQVEKMVSKREGEQFFYTERYDTKEGEVLTEAGFCDFIYDNNLNGNYVVNNMNEYFDQQRSINLHVENGVIVELGISNSLLQ
ncbi:MAG: hypothetical protein VB082_10780, partial [Christensenella sp.]|nr:hypothetical protein [Christensenella sp.]